MKTEVRAKGAGKVVHRRHVNEAWRPAVLMTVGQPAPSLRHAAPSMGCVRLERMPDTSSTSPFMLSLIDFFLSMVMISGNRRGAWRCSRS